MINLGQITFGIAPDTRRLTGAISEITNFGRQVNAAFRNMATGGADVARQMQRQEQAMINSLMKVQRFQDQVRKVQGPAHLFASSTTALRGMIDQLARGPRDALAFQRAMERFNVTMSNSQRRLQEFKNSLPTTMAGGSKSGLAAAFQHLAQTASLVSGPMGGVAARLSTISSLMDKGTVSTIAFVAGLAAGAYVFYKLGTAALDAAKKMEQVTNTLTAVRDSSFLAGKDIEYLYGVAGRAGTSFDVLAKQFGQIRAAAKGTNLEGAATKDIFEAVTFASSKLGLSAEDTGGVLRAIQQIMSKGTVQAEELRGQLGDRLPGAFAIMASSLGVTTKKLDEMMKKGEVSSKALIGFAEELKKRYNIDVSKPVDTIVAAEGRLATAFQKFNIELDKAVGFSAAYKNSLNALTGGLDYLTRNMGSLGSAIGAVSGALVGLMIPTLITGFTAMGVAIWNMARGMAAFSIASMASGLGGLGMLLLRVAGAAGGAYAGMKLMEGVMSNSGPRAITATVDEIQKFIKAQEKAKFQVSETTNEYAKQVQLMQVVNFARVTALTAELEKLSASATSTAESSFPLLEKLMGKFGFSTNDGTAKKIETIRAELAKLGAEQATIDSIAASIAKIFSMPDVVNKPDPLKDVTDRMKSALKEAKDTINETQQLFAQVYQAPAAQEWGKVQVDINKHVEDFRDKLTKAKLPAEEIIRLTNEYAVALRGLKEGEYNMKHLISSFQMLEQATGKAFEAIGNNMIDSFLEGKDMMETLRDTWKTVLADMLKESFKFMLLNPIKNAMFGTNYQSWSPGSTQGSGGFLGSLFGMGGNNMTGVGAHVPGGYSQAFPMPAFAKGGVTNQPSVFGDDGWEAAVPLPDGRSIPVDLRGGGGDSGGGSVNPMVNVSVGGADDDLTLVRKILATFKTPAFEAQMLASFRKAKQARKI